jgi:hypothetical protein
MFPIKPAILTGAILLAVLLTPHPLPAQTKSPSPDAAEDAELTEIHHYILTLDKLEKAAAATDAFKQMMAKDPTLKKRFDFTMGDERPLDQQVKRMESQTPQVAAMIRAKGLTPRDYLLIRLAFVFNAYCFQAKKEGSGLPAEAIRPENQALFENNYAKVVQLGKRLDLDGN